MYVCTFISFNELRSVSKMVIGLEQNNIIITYCLYAVSVRKLVNTTYC